MPPPRDVEPLRSENRRAMNDGEIEVQYQPVMRVGDGAVGGFDVLLVWQRNEPSEFAA